MLDPAHLTHCSLDETMADLGSIRYLYMPVKTDDTGRRRRRLFSKNLKRPYDNIMKNNMMIQGLLKHSQHFGFYLDRGWLMVMLFSGLDCK